MPFQRSRALVAGLLVLTSFLVQSAAGQEPSADRSVIEETIQVTATRVPAALEPVPVSITVVSGDDLRARGATTLEAALELVAGVAVAPGGDGGPASAVPELWGLKEMDAYLLVVDGVPRGGAFNPDLATLDLTGVDRIEVLRGAAPVVYGATSFVGVIHVLHLEPGTAGNEARIAGGSHGSGGASVRLGLPGGDGFGQSLTAGVERRGFRDDRTGYDRGQVLYRATKDGAGGRFRFDLEGTAVRQDPASPHPRQGRVLSAAVPLDANHNPSDARLDEDRFQLTGGFDRQVGSARWDTTLSFTHTSYDVVRGYLRSISNTSGNATGFRQDRSGTDLYFDTHFAFHPTPELSIVAGVDHLYGRGEVASDIFDYTVGLDGRNAPASRTGRFVERTELEDERNFSGLYGQVEWSPTDRVRVELGVRLNRTSEDREGEAEGAEEEEEEGQEALSSSRETTRGSGILGVSYLLWGTGSDDLWIYANYRNSFKPAAIDFGPEVEGGILKPETAQSYEVGARGHLAGGRVDWEASAFRMNFENLVLSQISASGLPILVNAGAERFEGVELELGWRITDDLRCQLAGSLHDAEFRDFLREFDGVPTQLRGNRLELSPRELASAGLVYSPARGFTAQAVVQYVGERWLNARNTALAADYTTYGAGVGYRFGDWGVRLDGRNLGDTRPAISESEVGDAQYYRLPARSFELALTRRF